MFFNENELYQMIKLRQEETERKALNAWRHRDVQHETFLQKLVEKWSNPEKSITVQQNCGSTCEC